MPHYRLDYIIDGVAVKESSYMRFDECVDLMLTQVLTDKKYTYAIVHNTGYVSGTFNKYGQAEVSVN